MSSDPGDEQTPAPPPFTAGGRVPEEFEGTRIDLGDDLVEKTAILIAPGGPLATTPPEEESEQGDREAPPEDTRLDTPTQIEDHLESARILMTEGLLDEAKRILRRIILADTRHVIARKMLEEIHEQELKQIFGEGRLSRSRRGAQEDFDVSPLSSELVMRQLDRDLKLGVFDEGDGGEAMMSELSLFESKDALESFGAKLERDLAGTSARDRVDTGIAFLEMGLYDLAARQFRAATREVEFKLSAAGLLAYSLVLAGRPFEATMELEALLGDSELVGAQRVEFMYLMGRAYEGLKNLRSAFQWYQQAQEAEPRYRDTGERMDWIARQLGKPRRPQ
jgi:tetratricopeptide (TPR) repeat protein